ncbi:alpha/beta hydrolase [Amycolatopsis jejuensis]|uniref:alpha/beta hydrolase n=1 Tax=Amycolatopsis jejuensis TaxID=330084 RepID=UPI00068C081E|nr:alpha/beta hydrolase [Amycolatopsis jejuensis]
MPLDQAAAAFIENAANKPAKPLSETSVAEMRESVEALIPLGFEREDVHAVDDWAVDGVAVRSYVPGLQPLGNVVYLHGGSFTRCGLHTHDTLYRRFANRSGCTVVAVDYSLAPEETYPRQLDEIAEVVDAVARASPGAKLFIAGESSGGCLAAATTLRMRDGGPSGLDGLVLLLPVLDRDSATESRRTLAKDYLLTGEQMDWMFEQYAPDADNDDPLVFPFRATDLRGFPPTVVVTAEFDPLRDEGHAFAERIREAGGQAEDVCVPGIIHHAPLVPKRIPAGARVIDDAGDLLRKLASCSEVVR